MLALVQVCEAVLFVCSLIWFGLTQALCMQHKQQQQTMRLFHLQRMSRLGGLWSCHHDNFAMMWH